MLTALTIACEWLVCTDLSDHLPVFQIITNVKARDNDKDETKQYRQINEQTLNVLNHELEKEGWEDIYYETNPQTAQILFFDKLSEAFNKSVPIIKHSSKSFKKSKTRWITKDILTARKIKERMYKKFIENPSEMNEVTYKRIQNKFNKMIKVAKKTYYLTD